MSVIIMPDTQSINSVSVSQTKPGRVACILESRLFVCKGCVLFGFVARATYSSAAFAIRNLSVILNYALHRTIEGCSNLLRYNFEILTVSTAHWPLFFIFFAKFGIPLGAIT